VICAAAAAGFLGKPGRAAAQAAPGAAAGADVERFERTLEQVRRETRVQVLPDVPPAERALIDYGGYLTASYLSLDDADDDNRAFRGYDLVGYGRLDFDGVHDFYARGRATYRDFNSGDSFDGASDHLEGHVEEAYYRFNFGRYAELSDPARANRPGELTGYLQVGRQFEVWADGLVLSQYVDAVRAVLEIDAFQVELLASVTAHDITIDFDASRPEFEDETYRGFYGALASVRAGPHRPFAYVLVQRDHNSDDALTVGTVTTRFGYDSVYLGIGSTGGLGDRLSYGAEIVYETGRALSRVDVSIDDPASSRQTREDIQAFAAEAHLDYVPGDARRSRLGGGLVLASGDDDRRDSSSTVGGNRSGTDDTSFNALGFLDDGLAFAPQISNVVILRGLASTYPAAGKGSVFEELQVGVEGFIYFKFDEDAPIAEPTSRGAGYLGVEPDVFLNWQILDDVSLSVRYGVFLPGSAAFDSGGARHFFYAGLTYVF
jgi:hypothetical protein